jgi:hypothetical protein
VGDTLSIASSESYEVSQTNLTTVFHGKPWNSMATAMVWHGIPWTTIIVKWHHCRSLQTIAVIYHGIYHGIPWTSMVVSPWNSIDFHGISPWNSMVYSSIYVIISTL